MALNFDTLFSDALAAGLTAAKPGGKAAEDWLRESAKANEETLRLIAEGIAEGEISKKTGQLLLKENARALESEAAALSVALKASAQAAVNAFLGSLYGALKSALKLVL